MPPGTASLVFYVRKSKPNYFNDKEVLGHYVLPPLLYCILLEFWIKWEISLVNVSTMFICLLSGIFQETKFKKFLTEHLTNFTIYKICKFLLGRTKIVWNFQKYFFRILKNNQLDRIPLACLAIKNLRNL